jgi:GNAT superfamily N-acetyltransferase
MGQRSWHVRRVFGEDALAAIDILREASEWTSAFGHPIWPSESFTVEAHREIASAGEQIGGFEESKMVACMRLQAADPIFWPDDAPGEALYLHKLAVRRASSGKGWPARMVDWAVGECRRKGASALRLDTLANDKLPPLYEALGFHLVGETSQMVGGGAIVRMQRLVRVP